MEKLKISLRKYLIIIMLCVLGLRLENFYAAVVTDNDGSSFISKVEFEVLKDQTEMRIKNIVTTLNTCLGDEVQTILSRVNSADEAVTYAFDKIYPIGVIVVAETAPGLGTWEEISSWNGQCLWALNRIEFGGMLPQQMPLPSFNVEEVKHNHTYTLPQIETDETSNAHTHGPMNIGDTGWNWQTFYRGSYESGLQNTSPPLQGDPHEPHKHKFKLNVELSKVEDHTHDIVWSDDNPYKGAPGSKVQPNAYVVKLWKRTA